MTRPAVLSRAVLQRVPTASRPDANWWLPLVAGIGWFLFAIIVLRFDYHSVTAVATLFGVVVLIAAANELAVARLSTPGWRGARSAAAVLLVVIAVTAFVDPGGTFVSLAAVMSFYFVLAGALDISAALALRSTSTAWGVGIATGIVEVLLGLWAAGSWEMSVVTLVGLVGGVAIARGTGDLVLAFHVKDQQVDPLDPAREDVVR